MPTHPKQPSLLSTSFVSRISSSLKMKMSFGSSSTRSSPSAQGSVVCPHCNRSSMANSHASPSTSNPSSPIFKPANRISSLKLSLQEVLQSLPDHGPLNSSLLIPKNQMFERGPFTALRGSRSIVPMVQNKTKKIWKRTRTSQVRAQAPPRPQRPPPEQCPSDQSLFDLTRAQVFPNLPQLVPELPELPDFQGSLALDLGTPLLQPPMLAHQDSYEALIPSVLDPDDDIA